MGAAKFDVEDFKKEVNRRNRESTCTPGARLGGNLLLEWVLNQSEGYRGFRYLNRSEVPAESLPGINSEHGVAFPLGLEFSAVYSAARTAELFRNTDSTRIEYL